MNMNTLSRFAPRLPVASDWHGPPLELLKWLALVLMVVDHVGKYVFKGAVPGLFEAGRISMPLFVFVLACNLARPDSLPDGRYRRVLSRLAFVGLIATVPYTLLQHFVGGYWWPLNMMFTLFVGVGCASLFAAGGVKNAVFAVLLFVFGGLLGEFWWPAIALLLCVWAYFRSPSLLWLLGALLSAASLSAINQNQWALAAFPIVFASRWWSFPLPRVRDFFYWFYPLHFAALLAFMALGL